MLSDTFPPCKDHAEFEPCVAWAKPGGSMSKISQGQIFRSLFCDRQTENPLRCTIMNFVQISLVTNRSQVRRGRRLLDETDPPNLNFSKKHFIFTNLDRPQKLSLHTQTDGVS